MILGEDIITGEFPRMYESLVDYGEIKKGDQVVSFTIIETPKGSCNYHKVVAYGSDKVHYLFTHEVTA